MCMCSNVHKTIHEITHFLSSSLSWPPGVCSVGGGGDLLVAFVGGDFALPLEELLFFEEEEDLLVSKSSEYLSFICFLCASLPS